MRTQLNRSLLLLGSILLLALSAHADSIALRDGRHVHGKFLGGTQGVIAFEVAGATQYFNVSDVLVMTFEGEDESSQSTQQHSVTPKAESLLPQNQKMHAESGAATSRRHTSKTI